MTISLDDVLAHHEAWARYFAITRRSDVPKEFIPEANEAPNAPRTRRTKAEVAKENFQAELRESATEIVLSEQPEGEIGLG